MHSVHLCRTILKSGFTSVRSSVRYVKRKDHVFPSIDFERDVVEKFVHGSGPGGMNVNAAVNKCVLKHTPTGIVVFSHDTRDLERNREIARKRLVEKLDNHLNGEHSFSAQTTTLKVEIRDGRRQRAEEKRRMKAEALEERRRGEVAEGSTK